MLRSKDRPLRRRVSSLYSLSSRHTLARNLLSSAPLLRVENMENEMDRLLLDGDMDQSAYNAYSGGGPW